MSDNIVDILRDKVSELKEENTQLRELLFGKIDDCPVWLSLREFAVLKYIVRRPHISGFQMGESENPTVLASVMMRKLRKKLKPLGVEIKSKGWHGYWIEVPGLDRLRAEGVL